MTDEPLRTARAPEEPLVTASQVDEQLKIPASTLGRMRRAGLLQAYYVGATSSGVRYRISEILDAIRTRPTTAKKKPVRTTTGKTKKKATTKAGNEAKG